MKLIKGYLYFFNMFHLFVYLKTKRIISCVYFISSPLSMVFIKYYPLNMFIKLVLYTQMIFQFLSHKSLISNILISLHTI